MIIILILAVVFCASVGVVALAVVLALYAYGAAVVDAAREEAGE